MQACLGERGESQKFAILRCRNFGLWVQLAASRQRTLHTAEDLLHYVCRQVHYRERESLLLQLDVHLENAGFQLISHTELQGHSIADPDLELDFRICSQLRDHNIDLATNTSIITKFIKKKKASLKK